LTLILVRGIILLWPVVPVIFTDKGRSAMFRNTKECYMTQSSTPKHDLAASYEAAVAAHKEARAAEAARYRDTLGGLADTAVTQEAAPVAVTPRPVKALTVDEINDALFG
jgi:hypothetical protein